MRRLGWICIIGVLVLVSARLLLMPSLEHFMAPKLWKYEWQPPPVIEARIYVWNWEHESFDAPGPQEVLTRADSRVTIIGAAAQSVLDTVTDAMHQAKPLPGHFGVTWAIVIARNGVEGERVFLSPANRAMIMNGGTYSLPPSLLELIERMATFLDPTLLDILHHQQRTDLSAAGAIQEQTSQESRR
jgi:hypothetical protein